MTLIEMVRCIFANYDPSNRNKFKSSQSTPLKSTEAITFKSITPLPSTTITNITNNAEKKNTNELFVSSEATQTHSDTKCENKQIEKEEKHNQSEEEEEEVEEEERELKKNKRNQDTTLVSSPFASVSSVSPLLQQQKELSTPPSTPSSATSNTSVSLSSPPLGEKNFVNPQGVRFQIEDEQERQELRRTIQLCSRFSIAPQYLIHHMMIMSYITSYFLSHSI
jgi:hypothetical protein